MRIAKIFLWFLGGAAVLVAAAVVALLVVDWNLLRGTINERASAASGRSVEIRGDLDLDIWSWTPAVSAREVVFANAPWAEEPEMLRVEEVHARIRLTPLLAGRLEVERLRLVRPQVHLERRDGEANWDLGASSPSEAALEAAAPDDRTDFPILRHAEVEGGTLTFRDPEFDEPIEVALDRVTVESGTPDDPVNVMAEGTFRDRPFSLEGRGDSFATFRSEGESYDVALTARIGDTALKIEGPLGDPLTLEGADAALELRGETLEELYTLFGLSVPESPPYAISGRLSREGDRWAVSGFEGRLGESDLAGEIAVETGGDRPRLVADLRSEAFRVEDLEGFWGGDGEDKEEEEAEAAADDGHILSDEPIELPKLRNMDAAVRFQGKSISSGALRLEDLAADLKLDDGLLTLAPLELGLAEGRIAADLRLDGREEVPSMAADVSVQGLDINALLALLGQEQAAAGLLQGRVKLETRGRSLREFGAAANGEGALIMSGGRIQNLIVELIALDLQEAIGQWLTEEEEQVEILCLAMPTRVESGRFVAQPWILDTTDAIVVVTGFVDLESEEVRIELEPHPKDFSLFNYLTTIEITGDLSERTAVANPVEAAAKVVLKAVTAPIMPLLSPPIQEGAEARSTPCPDLARRLEGAMAEGDPLAPAPGDAAEQEAAEQEAVEQEAVEQEAAARQPAEPEAAETASDPQTVSRVQSALNEAGFDLTVDGILGPNTRAALREFQRRRDLPPDGRPTPSTLRALGLAAQR
ncbi:MAG: AsmA family protein [Bacteroidota bacterium]|nr:AsmA family protein [Kiloniellaceae bacterium]